MASTPSLSDLITRWRELRQEGRVVSAADLGGDCPELLSDPSRCHEAVAFMEDFLGLARDSVGSYLALSAAPLTHRLAQSPNSAGGRPQPVPAETLCAADILQPAPQVKVPTIPGYEILGRLGAGGMGVVYKARQCTLNRIVALKMLRGRSLPNSKQRERFRREAESVARLQHPHVVQIFEVGEHD